RATREDPRVALGASPRGSLALLRLARAEAATRPPAKGRDPMNRIWVGLPIAVMVAVPLLTSASAPVYMMEVLAVFVCIGGVLRYSLGALSAGAGLAVIGYTVALWSSAEGVDVIGATAFGLALLLLLDLGDFARRFRGAAVASSVVRAQIVYWAGRATLIFGAVIFLTLVASALAEIVRGTGRSVVAGLGAVLAFAGAIYAGLRRTEAGRY